MPPPPPSRTLSPSWDHVPTHQSVTRIRIFSHMEGNWEESGAVSGGPRGHGGQPGAGTALTIAGSVRHWFHWGLAFFSRILE